jgi:hypothetical protein
MRNSSEHPRHQSPDSRWLVRSVLALALVLVPGSLFAQTPSGPPTSPPPPPREHVPYNPGKEPAFKGEGELRKGADALRSGGEGPFPQIVKKVGPDLFELGTITLDQKAKNVKIPGRINMTKGILEYLAVMDKRGKLHESVLALDVQPSFMQLALILLGLEPGELAPGDPVTRKPPTLTKPGAPVLLWVEWNKDGKTERIPADSLLFNRETQKAGETVWHFTGSFFNRGAFAADVTGSLIATWPDFRAIINASAQAGNPYRGANAGFEVNSQLVPPLDTPIRLVIEPTGK